MLKYLLLILIVIALILPFQVDAFLEGPIVPCGTKASERDCTLCDFFVMAKRIIDFLLELILVIAPVFVVVGGIVILTSAGKPDQASWGKRIITSAIIGVIIALLSWTILGMLFNALVGGEGFPWPWNEFECKGGGITEEENTENRCSQISSAGFCLGNNYSCQAGVIDQIPDAASELTNLLNCMAPRLPSTDAREISSISDNSGGWCFYNWHGQCSIGTDSCTGTCCGHSQYSLHYGGKNCRDTSYAVDFAKESFFNYIHNAAKTCATDLGLGKVDVVYEGNHVHVELEGVAKNKGCL